VLRGRRQAELGADARAGLGESLKRLEGRDRVPEFIEQVIAVALIDVGEERLVLDDLAGVNSQHRRVPGFVEEGGILFQPAHESADAFIALPDGARWGPRFGWGYFCRRHAAHDFTGEACGAPAFCWRRAFRCSRLAADFSLRSASLRRCSRFTFQ
jgi:hypothetical protein